MLCKVVYKRNGMTRSESLKDYSIIMADMLENRRKETKLEMLFYWKMPWTSVVRFRRLVWMWEDSFIQNLFFAWSLFCSTHVELSVFSFSYPNWIFCIGGETKWCYLYKYFMLFTMCFPRKLSNASKHL